MVQMNNVRKVYESSNTVALDGVSLTINDGEVVFLVGKDHDNEAHHR